MVMFLMALCLSGFGLAVTCIAFAAATNDERTQPEAQPAQRLAVQLAQPRFFSDQPAIPLAPPRVPIEVLLLQIERHVRLEQAAAESFLDFPSAASLHSRTMSPLVQPQIVH
jgi:hypothetical protein